MISLCTVITLVNDEANLYMNKCFFQAYATAILHFMKSFFIVMNVDLEIFVKTHVFLYFYNETEAVTRDVL